MICRFLLFLLSSERWILCTDHRMIKQTKPFLHFSSSAKRCAEVSEPDSIFIFSVETWDIFIFLCFRMTTQEGNVFRFVKIVIFRFGLRDLNAYSLLVTFSFISMPTEFFFTVTMIKYSMERDYIKSSNIVKWIHSQLDYRNKPESGLQSSMENFYLKKKHIMP